MSESHTEKTVEETTKVADPAEDKKVEVERG